MIIGMVLALILHFLGSGDFNPALSAMGLASGENLMSIMEKVGAQVAGALAATQVSKIL
jgi:hypothetical protein